MDQQGINYVRQENCFLEIDDLETTQKLCDKFAHRRWERVWDAFARRVKHWVKQNSFNIYNKGSVLRVEITVNNSSEFHISAPQSSSRRWKPMPKGVPYFWHYYQIGCQANQRYLDALQQIHIQGKAALNALNSLCRSQQKEGRRIAKFNPITEADCSLFTAVLDGEHILTGFRNRHVRASLYDTPAVDEQERKRRCARASRLIAKLRGHELVEKVTGSHLYRVTNNGYQVMSAALHYRFVDFPNNFARA